MSLTTAHDILTKINILDPEEKIAASKRHPKNEFQAYAYKLAHDLNDLQHLQIYMRLAKNIDRVVMEKAYSFVSDSSSNDRGRLFLWKLKQIRKDEKRKRDMKNFDYDFVISRMSKVRDILSELIREKVESEYSIEDKKMFHDVFKEVLSEKKDSKRGTIKILILGYCSTRQLVDIKTAGFNIYGMEVSKKLTKFLKNTSKELDLKLKWVSKDFLKNSFETHFFDAILISSYWSVVPKDSEIRFLKEVRKVLKKNGKLIINSKASKSEKEEWKIVRYKGEDIECFYKKESFSELKETLGVLFNSVIYLK